MEVELALDIDQYEGYELLATKGWNDYAYKRAYLPVVFPGLRLCIQFINKKGEEKEVGFVVIDATYSFRCRILEVYIKLEDPYFLCELVTEKNGWSGESVF